MMRGNKKLQRAFGVYLCVVAVILLGRLFDVVSAVDSMYLCSGVLLAYSMIAGVIRYRGGVCCLERGGSK